MGSQDQEATKFGTELPADVRDAAALVQAQLRETVAAVDERTQDLSREQVRRRRVALVLKVASIISGLVIATGFAADVTAQVLGGLISGIAALERAFANMSRLLAVTAAKNAYERLRRSVEARHNREVVDVVRIRDRDPTGSADRLIERFGELRDELATKRDEVESRLEKNDYDNLGRLDLDDAEARA